MSDEDLFTKAHEELQTLHASEEPFFRLVFSSSNHTPFEYPDNRIEQYDEEKNTVNNAVKYADHDARVWGDELVPIKNFHIPGLILGADMEGRRPRGSDHKKSVSPCAAAPETLPGAGLWST